MIAKLQVAIDRLPMVFAWLLGGLLIGYAIGGRGFAHHTGVYPVYLSEVALLLGAAIFVLGIRKSRPHYTTLVLIAFMVYAGIHTTFALDRYGFDAARDAVIWTYGIFALALAFMLRREHLPSVVATARWLVPAFLIWVPIASILRRSYFDQLPSFASTNVPIVYFISGDFAVLLSGVAAFMIFGFMTWREKPAPAPLLVAMWITWAVAVYVTFNSRGALLTVVISLIAAQILYLVRTRGRDLRLVTLLSPWIAGIGVLLVLPAVGLSYETQSTGATVDARYVANSLTSMYGTDSARSTEVGDRAASVEPSDDAAVTSDDSEPRSTPQTEETASESEALADPVAAERLDRATERQLNTRQWRLDWWRTIVDYTVRGEHFWTGKGFGVNLADSDGFQIGGDPPLRSPHNVHMTVLARMGVPGLAGWLMLQAIFALSVLRIFMRQSGTESDHRLRAFAGVVLIIWLAVMVNSSFDVYLEGPQGGIWFWSVFGLGLALIGFDEHDRRQERVTRERTTERRVDSGV